MRALDSSDTSPFCWRPSSPIVLAACALFAATTLLATNADASPAPKVEVCHIPPGNPANFHTIRVSENALAKHLAHGDMAGACNDVCAVLCDDGNACTIDDTGDCENSGCPTTPEAVDCNDSNACTADSCDPATGCEYTALTGTTCTVQNPGTCEEGTGVCDSAGACDPDRTAGCCLSTAECEAWDTNLCTNEECIDTACVTTSTVTCETDACHISVCTPSNGTCTDPEPVVCEQPECHVNGCDPITGCFSNPIPGCCVGDDECYDGNNCTYDMCLGVDGCDNPPCAFGDECNVLVDCDPDTCVPETVPEVCEDDGDLCTAESCVDGLGCVSDPVECPVGEECNSQSGACEPTVLPCFSTLNAPPGSTIAQCVQDCDANAECPPGICDLKFANTALVNACLSGDTNSCLIIDQFGRDNGCQNICPLPEPEGPDLLLCGGARCARYDAAIVDLANPVVRNFIEDYTFVHPESGVTTNFNFAQAIGADGLLWASDCGTCRGSDNFTNVWKYDPDPDVLVSCDSWGASGNLGRVCEDSAVNGCIGSVCGELVYNGSWRAAPVAATHLPGGIYASGNVAFWQGTRSTIVRLSAAGYTSIATDADIAAGCSEPGLATDTPGLLEAAPLDPADPGKEELYATVRYQGTVNEHWIVKIDVQLGTCSEVAVVNSEAGSNAVPFLSANSVGGAGGTIPTAGMVRIRVASDGTVYFLIRPIGDTSDDGIWRMADTNGDGNVDGSDSIVKIIDWVDGQNEIWDFAIGPHDGNLYLLLADEPTPMVGRVRIYESNVTLGDPPLGDVFQLPVTHGTQTRIEFFPLN